MVKLINWLTVTTMYVTEDRLDKYLAAGHKLADVPVTKEKPKSEPKAKKTK
jgi:hypothetical protein